MCLDITYTVINNCNGEEVLSVSHDDDEQFYLCIPGNSRVTREGKRVVEMDMEELTELQDIIQRIKKSIAS